jgi:RNA polymerase sigma factor for flagellar operon FliA
VTIEARNSSIDELAPDADAPVDAEDRAPAEQRAARARAAAAYGQGTRGDLEERLIVDHLPLVRHIVGKVAGSSARREDFEDLVSAGTLGLVKAARSYDPAKQVEFKTYAYIRVRGAVIDELRKRTFVPAGTAQQIRLVREAYQQHMTAHGSPPTDEQLARATGLEIAQLYKVYEETRRQQFLSIHGLTGAGEDSDGVEAFTPSDERPGPDAVAERREMIECMTEAIQSLPERDRIILILYYERDLTMKEAAAVLGVTESRVSQLHAAAVFKLSMKLRN